MWCFVCLCICVPVVCLVPTKIKRRNQIPWNWNYKQLWAVTWILGLEPKFSTGQLLVFPAFQCYNIYSVILRLMHLQQSARSLSSAPYSMSREHMEMRSLWWDSWEKSVCTCMLHTHCWACLCTRTEARGFWWASCTTSITLFPWDRISPWICI